MPEIVLPMLLHSNIRLYFSDTIDFNLPEFQIPNPLQAALNNALNSPSRLIISTANIFLFYFENEVDFVYYF
jgi:hypothetical protein